MTKTDFAENKTLDWCVGRTISPITAYVALYTSAPSDAGGGTEVTGAAYVRASTAPTDWSVASSGSLSNANPIQFPRATSNYPAPVTHWGIIDAASGGNLIRWAPLTTPKTITNGDTPVFSAGTLICTED